MAQDTVERFGARMLTDAEFRQRFFIQIEHQLEQSSCSSTNEKLIRLDRTAVELLADRTRSAHRARLSRGTKTWELGQHCRAKVAVGVPCARRAQVRDPSPRAAAPASPAGAPAAGGEQVAAQLTKLRRATPPTPGRLRRRRGRPPLGPGLGLDELNQRVRVDGSVDQPAPDRIGVGRRPHGCEVQGELTTRVGQFMYQPHVNVFVEEYRSQQVAVGAPSSAPVWSPRRARADRARRALGGRRHHRRGRRPSEPSDPCREPHARQRPGGRGRTPRQRRVRRRDAPQGGRVTVVRLIEVESGYGPGNVLHRTPDDEARPSWAGTTRTSPPCTGRLKNIAWVVS